VRNEVVRLQGAEVNQLAMPPFREEMLSVMLLPLRVPSRVIGMIVVGRRHADAFRPEDDELLLVVADRIALAIERASLDEGEREARRLAEAAAAEVQLLNAELEERVRLRTAELEATNRELEAFSYSVSHDLRAPLRSVDGFSVALEEDYGAVLSGEGKHYLARIRAGVQRMGQLIDALLQLSRITRADIVIEPVDLSALASQVADELSQEHPGRNIRFQIEPGLTAQGDVNLLRAVLENMFGNAVKFTARLAEAHIAFGYSPERGAYYVRDNGAGFDQQYASKLFVAFQRLHGDKDFKGSGIGLASVARVIRRHHGTMSAEGVVDGGATFWFTLGSAQ
jgi:light-regulated signal transduction histidine kinase (bacteriophytochrome)